MLDSAARRARYLKQTGRKELTPRQRRRDDKKALAQSQEAAARREGVAVIRRRATAKRAENKTFARSVKAATS